MWVRLGQHAAGGRREHGVTGGGARAGVRPAHAADAPCGLYALPTHLPLAVGCDSAAWPQKEGVG